MRRVVLYGLGWLAAATVAVLLAWQGVQRVGTSVTGSHPRALSADEARETLAAEAATTTTAGDQPAPVATATTTAGPAATATTRSTTSRPSASSTSTTRPAGPAATGPTTTQATSTASTSAPPAATGVVRTYNLVGGSATLRFEPSGKVTVVWANPNPGYRVEVDDRDGGGVRIRFDGEDHRSELEAWWDGQPRERIEEQGDGGGSGRG
jgi:hypothetical protein